MSINEIKGKNEEQLVATENQGEDFQNASPDLAETVETKADKLAEHQNALNLARHQDQKQINHLSAGLSEAYQTIKKENSPEEKKQQQEELQKLEDRLISQFSKIQEEIKNDIHHELTEEYKKDFSNPETLKNKLEKSKFQLILTQKVLDLADDLLAKKENKELKKAKERIQSYVDSFVEAGDDTDEFNSELHVFSILQNIEHFYGTYLTEELKKQFIAKTNPGMMKKIFMNLSVSNGMQEAYALFVQNVAKQLLSEGKISQMIDDQELAREASGKSGSDVVGGGV
jgi:hypothetical protein